MVDDEERKRLVFTIFLLADALVASNFTAFHVLSDPERLTFNVTIISWVIFVAVLIAVNIWLYYVYLKKPQNQARSASP
jgi:uncharacterized BrkB/YihY/UPF0761 family membrane protein